MTEREKQQYNMQIQVKKYLDGQVNKWNNIPAINRYKNSLDENLEAITLGRRAVSYRVMKLPQATGYLT